MGDLYTKPMAKSASLRRGLSPTIWSQASLTEISNGGLTEGFGIIDDFLSNNANDWKIDNVNNGTAVLDVAAKGGVLLLDSASTTQHDGAQIQLGGAGAASSFVPSASATIYYEARIKLADIGSTTVHAFLGLSEVDATTIHAGANSSANHIGFEAINTTAMGFHGEKATVRGTTAAVHTVVDDAYVKLGFVVEGLTKVTPYVNGVAKASLLTANIPILPMTPTFVCKVEGTTDPIMHIDWVACYQVEQIAN